MSMLDPEKQSWDLNPGLTGQSPALKNSHMANIVDKPVASKRCCVSRWERPERPSPGGP